MNNSMLHINNCIFFSLNFFFLTNSLQCPWTRSTVLHRQKEHRGTARSPPAWFGERGWGNYRSWSTYQKTRWTRLASVWFGLTVLHFFLVSGHHLVAQNPAPGGSPGSLAQPCLLHCTLWHCLVHLKSDGGSASPLEDMCHEEKRPQGFSSYWCGCTSATGGLLLPEEEDTISWGGLFLFLEGLRQTEQQIICKGVCFTIGWIWRVM